MRFSKTQFKTGAISAINIVHHATDSPHKKTTNIKPYLFIRSKKQDIGDEIFKYCWKYCPQG